jgi:hypothetical protein
MLNLPDNLPSIANARLPQLYEKAKSAITECGRIDECKDWANKAEALASYARQAKDNELQRMAKRIQARALRRSGELLKIFQTGPEGGRPEKNGRGDSPVSQRQAAADAGLSKDQEKTAVRVANIPEEEFDKSVDSDDPPTVTALAKRGRKARTHIGVVESYRSDFDVALEAEFALRRFAAFCQTADVDTIVRGTSPIEIEEIRKFIGTIDLWLDRLAVKLADNTDVWKWIPGALDKETDGVEGPLTSDVNICSPEPQELSSTQSVPDGYTAALSPEETSKSPVHDNEQSGENPAWIIQVSRFFKAKKEREQ